MKDKLLSIVINILATEIEGKSKYDDPTPLRLAIEILEAMKGEDDGRTQNVCEDHCGE